MSNPNESRPTPPPVPSPVVGYAAPAAPHRPDPNGPSSSQKVFDTVAGPNVRLKDNLIQLICVIVGAAIGAAVGYQFGGSGPMVIGIVCGMVGALVLSGVGIGVL